MRRTGNRTRILPGRIFALAMLGLMVGGLCWVSMPKRADADAPTAVASVIAIKGKLMLDRPGRGHYSAFVQMPDYINDQLTTDPKSVAAVEFAIGGRIGINRGSSIRIVGYRSATNASTGQMLRVNSGVIWAHFDKQKSPLIIQTRNSTIGIRGTEFLVDARDDSTTIDVFQGHVAYAPRLPGQAPEANPELPENASLAGPGERVVIKAALAAPVVNKYDVDRLRKEDAQRYNDLAGALVALGAIQNIAGWVPGGTPVACYAGYAATGVQVVMDPAQAARNFAANEVSSHVPFGGILGGVISSSGGSHSKKAPPFIVGLSPDQTTVDPHTLHFGWKPLAGAKQYVLLLSRQEHMNASNLDWSAQTSDTSVSYPQDGPPMIAGQKYYWRVVGIGANGKARGKASQTWLRTAPGSDHAGGQ